MAKLYFRYGAMSSGKTRDLMKVYYNYLEKNMRTIVMKPQIDVKGKGKLISRDGTTLANNYLISKKDNIYKLVKEENKVNKIDCVLIDEAQFLDTKNVEELVLIVDELKIPVICYGLKADFKTNLFPGSKRLIELADSIEELKTICYCGKKAIMNTRKINDKFVFSGEQVAIDGIDKVTYESLCRACYYKEKRKK